MLEHASKAALVSLAAGMLWVHTTLIEQQGRIIAMERRLDSELRAEITQARLRSDEADSRQDMRIAAVETTARAGELNLATIQADLRNIGATVARVEALIRQDRPRP